MLAVVNARLPFANEAERYRRQRQWLIELEHLLDPAQQPQPTSASVAQAVTHYLSDLTTRLATTTDPTDLAVAAHINQIFAGFWWGLFTCYDVIGLPRTNNELERFMRQLKMGQRRVSGRKNIHDFIIRYGAYVAFVDYQESEQELLARLQQVTHDDFLQERHALDTILLREQKIHRFTYHRQAYLAELEQRWATAVASAEL